MEKQWYEGSRRRNLIDMHIPDWDDRFLAEFDSKAYVEMLKLADVDTAYIYSSSCLGICYWPTKVGHMHEGLKGRDILGETINGCHDAGINVVVYFNIWSRWAYDNHPDWQVINANGQATTDFLWSRRYGVCCINSPYRDFVLAQVGELCSHYDFEGMWFDMILWPYTACYCHNCRKRYMNETGCELPTIVNWGDPSWVGFQRKREEWLAEFASAITSMVKREKPRASVGHQCAGWSTGWRCGYSLDFLTQSDYLSGDFYGGALDQSFTCKLFNSATRNRPFEFMTSRCSDLSHHTTMKPKELLKAQVYSAIANNGAFLFIDAIDPIGTLDERAYRTMGEIFKETKRFERYLDPSMEPCADVAIYMNLESLINLEDNGKSIMNASFDIPAIRRSTNIARSLLDEHIPFGVITKGNLEGLSGYQVLILSDLPMIDGEEAMAFKRFVEEGGSLYVSKGTSLLTKEGERKADFILSDLLGLSYLGETQERVTYMAPVGQEFFYDYSSKYPLMISGAQAKVKVKDDSAQILATITLPYADPEDPSRFASANSNPPGVPTDYPAIVLREYGKGRVLYVSGDLEGMNEQAHRDVFIRLIRLISARPYSFKVDAPKPVEVTLFHQRENRRFIINILNFQHELPNIPINGVEVKVRLDGRTPVRLLRLPDEAEVSYTIQGGYLEFTVPELETFAMAMLDYK